MKVRIDSELCSGHGRCYAVEPHVYSPDDEGYSSPLDTTIPVPDEYEKKARRGMRSCPEGAIAVVED